MNPLGALKAEYILQPRRLIRRLLGTPTVRTQGPYESPLPWGISIVSRVRDDIICQVDRLGVFDLCVTEAIWRLLQPGDAALDVGANIGYMTAVMAARLGTSGRVVAFEPEPEIFADLGGNAARIRAAFPGVRLDLHRVALSDTTSEAATLAMPDGGNRGMYRLGHGGPGIAVPTRCLDELDLGRVALMKLDVEYHEPAVLRGGERTLRSGAIRDVLVEDHAPYPSETTELLERYGFRLFGLERTLARVKLGAPADFKRPTWEAPSLLATRDPERVQATFRSPGWLALGVPSRPRT